MSCPVSELLQCPAIALSDAVHPHLFRCRDRPHPVTILVGAGFEQDGSLPEKEPDVAAGPPRFPCIEIPPYRWMDDGIEGCHGFIITEYAFGQ